MADSHHGPRVRRVPASVFATGLVVALCLTASELPARQAPASTTSGKVLFRDIAAAAGLGVRHVNGASPDKYFAEIMGSGGLFFDFDDDGWIDVFLVDGGSIANTHQDGSEVRRDANLKMVTSLRKHRVWTTMIMVAPGRVQTEPGGLPVVGVDEGQNAQIAKTVQEVTRGRYVPITGSGTSGLTSTILPELAQEIAVRYLRQMTQHRIVFERPEGAKGTMKNFSLALLNRPGARITVSTDGAMP